MSASQLTTDERDVISHMHAAGFKAAVIARTLGRHRGTIGRELARNRDGYGGYHYDSADRLAGERARACREPGATQHPARVLCAVHPTPPIRTARSAMLCATRRDSKGSSHPMTLPLRRPRVTQRFLTPFPPRYAAPASLKGS